MSCSIEGVQTTKTDMVRSTPQSQKVHWREVDLRQCHETRRQMEDRHQQVPPNNDSSSQPRQKNYCLRQKSETSQEMWKPPKSGSRNHPHVSQSQWQRGEKGAIEENQLATENKKTASLFPKASTLEEGRSNQTSRHWRILMCRLKSKVAHRNHETSPRTEWRT